MARRALAAALGALVLVAAPAMVLGGAEKPKREPRKKPEPVSTADYLKAIQTVLDVANELEKPESAAKGQELRDKVKAAAASLRLGGRGLESMLETEDNKALAARLKSYAYNSLRGKITYERQQLIKAKPELKTEYEKFQEKEKAIAAERDAFYQKLRPQAPDLDALEKVREALVAERERKLEEAKAARKKRQPKGERKKKTEK